MAATPGTTRIPAHVKAHATGRWAEIIFRALSAKVANRWQFVSFRGAGKGEWRGVVDVVAIRKDTSQPSGRVLNRGDLFDIVLVQVKGGSARAPTSEDMRRLRQVAKHYHARAVVQFQWKKAKTCKFSLLQPSNGWKDCTGTEVFG